MPITIDRFKKAFTDKVSPNLLTNRDTKAAAEIKRLEDNIAALKKANIDAAAYESYVPELKKQRTEATAKGTDEEKYKKLEQVKLKARQHADNAARALQIEPTKQDIDKLRTVIDAKGTDALDTIIGKLGGQAKDDKSKKLVIAAIKARWGLEKLNGDMSTKALPRLYNVMAMVPEDHIKGNTKLKEIRRDREPPPGEASFYRGSDDLIVLNLGKTGSWHGTNQTTVADDGTEHEASYFDHTTLHEIGHAVDERIGFMTNNGNTRAYGAWREESIESVARAGGQNKGFFDDFDEPEPLLLIYLKEVLRTGKTDPQVVAWTNAKKVGDAGLTKDDLLNDPGLKAAEASRVKFEQDGWPDGKGVAAAFSASKIACKFTGPKRQASASVTERVLMQKMPIGDAADAALAEIPKAIPPQSDWDNMAKHAAVAWCLDVRLKGKSDGLWEGGAGAAGKAKLSDGRVYQQAYETKWYSYDSSRPGNISSYQFRAPGEWFAELYAAFFLGWLPKNHWISTLKMPA